MDIDIYVKLIKENADSTVSSLIIDQKQVCYVLEDGYRSTKIKGQTRIPAGRYRLMFRTEGTHHYKYKKMYDWHVGMIELQDVPNYKYILIHKGNFTKDTEGCLLLGKDYQLNMQTGLYEVVNSTYAYTKVAKQITEMMKDNRVFINITR